MLTQPTQMVNNASGVTILNELSPDLEPNDAKKVIWLPQDLCKELIYWAVIALFSIVSLCMPVLPFQLLAYYCLSSFFPFSYAYCCKYLKPEIWRFSIKNINPRCANETAIAQCSGLLQVKYEPTTDANANQTALSKVIEVSNVPPDTRETDLVQIAVPFGKVTNVAIARNKNKVRFLLKKSVTQIISF